MEKNKYLMESLDQFLNEDERKMNQEYTYEEKLERILESYGIDLDEIYSENLRESIFAMADEIYHRREDQFTGPHHVMPN